MVWNPATSQGFLIELNNSCVTTGARDSNLGLQLMSDYWRTRNVGLLAKLDYFAFPELANTSVWPVYNVAIVPNREFLLQKINRFLFKVSPGSSLGRQGTSTHRQWVQKVQTNLITTIIWVSPPPMNILTTQTALADWLNTIHRSPPPSQNFETKATS